MGIIEWNSTPRPEPRRLLYWHAIVVLWLNILLGLVIFILTWPNRTALAQRFSPYGGYIFRSIGFGLYWSFLNFGFWFAGARLGGVPARIVCAVWGAAIPIFVLVRLANWPITWFDWWRLYSAAALLTYALFGDRQRA